MTAAAVVVLAAQRRLTLPAMERLTSPVVSSTTSDVYYDVYTDESSSSVAVDKQPPSPLHQHGVGVRATNKAKAAAAAAAAAGRRTFAIDDSERGVLDHGVSAEAKETMAHVEEEYRVSSLYAHPAAAAAAAARLDGNSSAMLPMREQYTDEATGATVRVTRVAAPFAATMVTSQKARYAHRGHIGELSAQQVELYTDDNNSSNSDNASASSSSLSLPPLLHGGGLLPRYTLDERAHVALRKTHQLDELLEAPMPAIAKAQTVRALLRDCYDSATALLPHSAEQAMVLFARASLQLRLRGGDGSSSSTATTSEGDGDGDARGRLAAARSAVVAVGDDSMHDVPLLCDMCELYAHMKRTLVAPTAIVLEQLMLTLSAMPRRCSGALVLAHRLLLDADTYMVLPTRTTYAAYFAVCHVNDAMHSAIARLRDAVVHLCVPLDAAMTTALLRGLNELGYVEEALAMLARLQHVPLTTSLLNAMLETLLLSGQSLACFSALQAVRGAGLALNADTYTLLLLACEQSAQWQRVTYVLAEMQRHRVKGNARTLNLLLKGLMVQKLDAYALQLHATMRRKRVPVWPALATGMQELYALRRRQRLGSSRSSGSNTRTVTSVTTRRLPPSAAGAVATTATRTRRRRRQRRQQQRSRATTATRAKTTKAMQ